MIDIIIATLPALEFYLPPAAPAVLKGQVTKYGFSCSTADLNLESKLLLTEKEFHDFFDFTTNDKKIDFAIIEKVYNHWNEILLQKNPTWVGLSVFSNDNIPLAMNFIPWFRDKNPKQKIIVGGNGTSVEEFCVEIRPYVDHVIRGEGELALIELLKGNIDYPGIDSAGEQIDNLDQLGYADYSEYNLAEYDRFYQEDVVQITGSRGCVRRCTFCNVASQWPKFRWRSGQHIFDEIKKTHQEKNVRHFYFTDSLINGNQKSYIEMCELLADYNSTLEEKVTWGGQYIFRKKKSIPQHYFEITAKSGAFNLAVGVETGSDRVRDDMRKHFHNDDLEYFIENFSKYKITCSYLMQIGYPTETQEDFEETLALFRRHHPYVVDGTILGCTLGQTTYLLRDAPIVKDFNSTIIVSDQGAVAEGQFWTSATVDGLDFKERARRRLVAQRVAESYGWSIISADRELRNLSNRVEEWTKFINNQKEAT